MANCSLIKRAGNSLLRQAKVAFTKNAFSSSNTATSKGLVDVIQDEATGKIFQIILMSSFFKKPLCRYLMFNTCFIEKSQEISFYWFFCNAFTIGISMKFLKEIFLCFDYLYTAYIKVILPLIL